MNLMMNGQIQATLSRKDDESIHLDKMMKEIDKVRSTLDKVNS